MSWTVYEHITPSGKRYIGITCRKPEYRWNNGRGYSKNTPFGKAIEKYKWDKIQHNILFNDLTEKEAKWLENYLICYYRTFVGFKDDCKGYNCTLGGEGSTGFEHTEESKLKMSEARKGKPQSEEHKQKIGEANKGKHLSEDTRRRMSESKKGKTPWIKGKHMSEETKLKMSEALKGKTPWNKGKHPSEETRRKQSEAQKGKHYSEETRTRMSESMKCKNKGTHRVYHEDGTFHMER